MINQKPVCFEPFDIVLFKGKEGTVMSIEEDKALIYCPDFNPAEPYVVCHMSLLVHTWRKIYIN